MKSAEAARPEVVGRQLERALGHAAFLLVALGWCASAIGCVYIYRENFFLAVAAGQISIALDTPGEFGPLHIHANLLDEFHWNSLLSGFEHVPVSQVTGEMFLIPCWFPLVLAAGPLLMVWKPVLWKVWSRTPSCLYCRYDLTGLSRGSACPECGSESSR